MLKNITQNKDRKSRKKLIALGLYSTLSFMSIGAHSDSILGLYAGAGVWVNTFEGTFENNGFVSTDELDVNDDNSNFFYIALEHPIPIIPNIKLSHLDLITESQTINSLEFVFNGQAFAQGLFTSTTVDLNHTDVTLYWEILDNWVNLDVGVTGRTYDGFVEVSAFTSGASITARADLTVTAPLAYAKAQLNLPFTGWFVAGTANYVSYNNIYLSDFDAKIGYMYDGPGLDVGIEVGYRMMKLETADLDELESNLTIDGPYASVVLHF